MKHGSIFTGGGGADVGLVQAGLEPVFFAEIDPHASAVLSYLHQAVPNFGDVTKIDPSELPECDLLWMSPPCQDLSVAGRREGLSGDRSNLFYEGVRIAKHLIRRGTRFVCMEQVPGLFSSDGPEDFRRVLRAFLELRPSDIGWRVLDTQWFDPPQKRERIFFVLDFGGKCAGEILSLAESMCGYPAPRREKGQGASRSVAHSLRASCPDSDPDLDTYIPEVAGTFQANNGGGGRSSNVDDAAHGYMIPDVCATLAGHGGGANEPARFGAIIPIKECQSNQWSKGNEKGACGPGIGDDGDPMYCLGSNPANMHGVAVQVQWASGGGQVENDTAQALRSNAEASYQFLRGNFGVRRLTPRECERCQGWPDDHTRWGRNAKGEVYEISDSQRYKMIGNGVSSPIPYWMAQNMFRALELERGAA